MADHGSIISWLRDPEYTGTNRCLPCTVVNLLIAAGVAVVLSVVLLPWAGLFTLVLFAGVIYLRGYLVPGTPTITERYFPAWLLELFGKRPLVERSFSNTATSPGETEAGAEGDADLLIDTGIVRDDGGSLGLTSNFRTEWIERMAALGVGGVEAEDVRVAFDADSVSRHGEQSFVLDGIRSLRWASQAALTADIAAAELLRERLDDWTERESDRQRSALTGLRFCLNQCPSCEGPLLVTEDRVDPCCQKPHLVAESVCDGCGAVVADAAVVEKGDSSAIQTRLLRP